MVPRAEDLLRIRMNPERKRPNFVVYEIPWVGARGISENLRAWGGPCRVMPQEKTRGGSYETGYS